MAPMFTSNFNALHGGGSQFGLGAPGADPSQSPLFTPFESDGKSLGGGLDGGSRSFLGGGASLSGGLESLSSPAKDCSQSERRRNLELLDASFQNLPTVQDQEVIDPR